MLPSLEKLVLAASLILAGCAGSEPSADEGVGASSQATTARAPEDAELESLRGRTFTLTKRVEIPRKADLAPLGEVTITDMTELGALRHTLKCSVAPKELTVATRWINPGDYVVGAMKHFRNTREGHRVEIELREVDGKLNDFDLVCEGLSRAPLAKEALWALEDAATVANVPAQP